MYLKEHTYKYTLVIGILLLLFSAIVNISIGSIKIPVITIWNIITNHNTDSGLQYILFNYRIPKTIASALSGMALSISGLLMQTYFRNPLAGPFVLGITSGASLGVAILLMGSTFLGFSLHNSTFSIPISASLGAFFVLSVVMLAAKSIRNTLSILIIGLMFGSFTSSIISILSYFSTANELQQYIFWSMGSLQNLDWNEINILLIIVSVCIISLFFIIKPLDALLLGENYAKSLGINIHKTQTFVFLITSILTGSITAFVGPIAFVGLAIPHIAKLVIKSSSHQTLLPAVGTLGAIVLLLCDTLSQISIGNKNLPINAITSLLGAPIVIWLLLSKSKKL